MNNLEKLTKAFVSSFEIDEKEIQTVAYKKTLLWDSVGQITLVTILENEFNIIIAPEDIMSIKSFETAKQILSENYKINF